MTTGLMVLNFGEPSGQSEEEVVAFLERIFVANSSLESFDDEVAIRRRSRELAERRAPALMEDYRKIGGSPLQEQVAEQVAALSRELARRGCTVSVYSAFQFVPPLIAEVVAQAREEGVERLVALPIYPLCGPSTNVAAIDAVRQASASMGWGVEMVGITGWHRHPLYLQLRSEAVLATVEAAELDLSDPGTRLVFSAHGTPKKYLEEGSRYVVYVEEFCREIARRLSVAVYELGYQNHSNRGIEWTSPGVSEVLQDLRAQRVIVDPVSFMHEQSETLAELDLDLKGEASDVGLEFHRVAVPHADPRFSRVLADLVEAQLEPTSEGLGLRFGPCRCGKQPDTVCLNSPS